MQLTPQIYFHQLDYSEAVASRIRTKIKGLEKYFSRIISVRVQVKPSSHRHHQGTLYQVQIQLTVPGGEIVVGQNSDLDHSHADIYVAIRDAFFAARRQLEDYVRIHFRSRRSSHFTLTATQPDQEIN